MKTDTNLIVAAVIIAGFFAAGMITDHFACNRERIVTKTETRTVKESTHDTTTLTATKYVPKPVYLTQDHNVTDPESTRRGDSLQAEVDRLLGIYDLVAHEQTHGDGYSADLFYSIRNRSFDGTTVTITRQDTIHQRIDNPEIAVPWFKHFGYGVQLGGGAMINGQIHAGLYVGFGVSYNF